MTDKEQGEFFFGIRRSSGIPLVAYAPRIFELGDCEALAKAVYWKVKEEFGDHQNMTFSLRLKPQVSGVLKEM